MPISPSGVKAMFPDAEPRPIVNVSPIRLSAPAVSIASTSHRLLSAVPANGCETTTNRFRSAAASARGQLVGPASAPESAVDVSFPASLPPESCVEESSRPVSEPVSCAAASPPASTDVDWSQPPAARAKHDREQSDSGDAHPDIIVGPRHAIDLRIPNHVCYLFEMIVDCWIQHPTKEMLHHEMFASLRRWMGEGTMPDELPLAMTIAALDAAGVDRGIVCAWVGPDGPMISNEQVAAQVAAHPSRLCGLASVDVRDPMEAVRELRRAVKEDGLIGLRLLPWLWGLPPDDRRFYPLYVECIELDIPFCLQVGHTGPMRTSEFGRPIPYLDHVALDFPELRIVAGHIGYPWTDEMIAMAEKYENVFIDTSAYKPRRYPPQLVMQMKKRLRDKVLFGSNWPMIAPGACLSQLDEIGLDEVATAKFLGENAARVFRLES